MHEESLRCFTIPPSDGVSSHFTVALFLSVVPKVFFSLEPSYPLLEGHKTKKTSIYSE